MAMRGRLSNDLLLPVGGAFIVSTLIVALMINLLPWSGVWLQVKPDFVALVVLYWCIHQPRKVGFTVAFSLGLIMDVAEGSVFGQHALAYSVLAYAGLVLHRRVQNFTLKGQVLHVLAILLLNDTIVLAGRMLAGGPFPGFYYFVGSFVGAALWPVIVYLFKMPLRPAIDPDRG
ncbi:MAG TPA: rod shape-determining protein MreD [Candidatus Binatia bacterium]|jgi:rod shape-determining protein MreD|nr:rod shape-determining protein MreD [Candidatus Binatia bacterium]